MTTLLNEQQEQALDSTAISLNALLGSLPHAVCHFDAGDELVLANRRFQQLYQLPDEAVLSGITCDDMLKHVQRDDVRRALAKALTSRAGFGVSDSKWETDDGHVISVSCESLPGGGYAALHEEIANRADDSGRVERQLSKDPLTGLLNREAFVDAVSGVLDGADAGDAFVLLYLGLDRFKPVNDTLGHPAGDDVLKKVADRIRRSLRATDIVARLGGDEFGVLQSGASQPSSSRALANRLIEVVSEPYDAGGYSVNVGASVGVAIAPFDGDDAADLLNSSDLAMRAAKENGRGVSRYFEPAMREQMQTRRMLDKELRSAIANDEFRVLYQPLIDVRSNRIVCAECLVRWQHPELGQVSPASFIPLAEETGLIVQIGEWVLQRACSDAADWGDEVRVAVNVSTVQLRDRLFPARVKRALEDANLPAERLELEITETSLMSDTDLTIAILKQLRDYGVQIVMDDFGTGYSSINYLQRFPFDKIKIDQSFVTGVEDDSEAAAIVRMVAALGVSLDVTITAEGVETVEDLEMVAQTGCDQVQGYYFSRPIPIAELSAMLKQNRAGSLP